jgi:hypothetical protein
MKILTFSQFEIYYNSSDWHILLKEISKLIDLQKQREIHSLSEIYFSHDRGDHLTILLQHNSNDQKNENLFFDVISSFIKKNRSETKPDPFPISSFFMNNYNNDIVRRTIQRPSKGDDSFRIELSAIMLTTLSEDRITLIERFTLLFYLLVTTFKVLTSERAIASSIIDQIIKYISNRNGDSFSPKSSEGVGLISGLQLNNREIVAEIVNDVWNSKPLDKNLTWLSKWIKYCYKYFKSEYTNQKIYNLFKIIVEHLALNDSSIRFALTLLNEHFSKDI